MPKTRVPVDQAERDARRWRSELRLADKREKDWRDEAERIVKRYRAEERRRNSFNVLWANTEILRPAVYNSQPNPDVRRRFRDADPLGKAVATVLERSLVVVVDHPATDPAIRNDVLDGLLPGRGVSRVRYVPSLAERAPPATDREREADDAADDEGAAESSDDDELEQELEYEQCVVEHVDWKDFRHGYGRTWDEVPWVAFRCCLTKPEAEEKFGADAVRDIKFAAPTTDDSKQAQQVSEIDREAEFWEVWDKGTKRVFFTNEHAPRLLFPVETPAGEPPLELDGFFPCPEPLRIVEDTGSLLPIPLYRLYEEQAAEVDTLTRRINKIVHTLRLRGVYDSRLQEIADLTSADDADMVPVKDAQMWAQVGGIDKAISWMPVEQAVAVLQALYAARRDSKQVIDEVLGISDIVRGATKASETLGAQKLKANFASVRIQRMQRAVQRYVRDLLRLAAEVMADRFQAETFAQMTNLKFPAAEERDLAQQAAAAGDTEAAALARLPTWDEILGLMRNDKLRCYRIDVETDSTVTDTLDSDMAGVSEVLGAVTSTLTGLAPLVVSGALPADAAKELVMAVVRRARLGLAVEDALDKLQAPQPPQAEAAPPPPPDRSVEVATVKAQADQAIAQMREQAATERAALVEQMKGERERWKVELDAAVKVIVAQLGAQKAADAAVTANAGREFQQGVTA